MQSPKSHHEAPEQSSLVKSIFRFLPYWPLFSVLMLVSLLLCFLYYLFATPLYEASARVLMQDKHKGTENSKAIEELDVLQSKKIVDNEIDVITSKPLVMEVVKQMHLYAPVYKKSGLTEKLLYDNAPLSIESANPEFLSGTLKVNFYYDPVSRLVIFDKQAYATGKWQVTPYGKLKFTSNPAYRPEKEQTAFLFILEKPASVAQSIKKRLRAGTTTKLSSMIQVTYRDENANRAEDFVDNLLAAYINAGKNDKSTLAANTLAFIDQRIKIIEKELNDIEQRKQQFASQKGAFDISTQGRLFLENVSANDQKMAEISMGLAVLNEVEDYVNDKKSSGIVPSTIGISDPMLSQLVEKLYNAELEYESLKKTAGENNPIVLPLKNRVEQIKPGITELIKNQRRNLEASRRNIFVTNNNYSSLLNALPKTERELVDLDREQNIRSGVYSFLLQKKEETALSQQSLVPENRLISTDVSEGPVSPNMILICLSGICVSVLLGMAIITVKESLGNKVMFRGQIEHATGFPVIGEISAGISHNPIVIGGDTKTFIAEQFRRLRITLNYMDVNADPKRILVTSAISGEGKSFIASNLALALAISGRKVALLDFDLNNPSLNNKLKINHYKGVTDFLLDEACSLEDIIHRTDLDPNLYIASTGRLPRNPTELLMNGRTELLLKQLDKEFDYIVIDTAPVIPVTDAYILSKLCDATLYVIRHRYTPKIFLERMDDDNKMHRLTNVGIIFNSVSPRGMGNHNYGYGYGYGYTFDNTRKRKRVGNSFA